MWNWKQIEQIPYQVITTETTNLHAYEVLPGRHVYVSPTAKIHNTSILGVDALISDNAYIGAHSIISSSVRIRENARIIGGAYIHHHACINEGTRIRKNGVVAPSVIIDRNDWWITVGPQGSRGDIVTAVYSDREGLRWWVGCQIGITTDEMKRRLHITHHNRPSYRNEYDHIINMVDGHPSLARARSATKKLRRAEQLTSNKESVMTKLALAPKISEKG